MCDISITARLRRSEFIVATSRLNCPNVCVVDRCDNQTASVRPSYEQIQNFVPDWHMDGRGKARLRLKLLSNLQKQLLRAKMQRGVLRIQEAAQQSATNIMKSQQEHSPATLSQSDNVSSPRTANLFSKDKFMSGDTSTNNDDDAFSSSQSENAHTKQNVHGVCSSVPKTPTRVLPPRTRRMRLETNAPTMLKKWKCDKTKVATHNWYKCSFSRMDRNRTGWTVGILRRDDGDIKQTYFIEWDGKPKVSHYVSYEEIQLLVRHHKQCSAQKLICLFCVGLDLLLVD
jgi:hypothetical protein